MATQYEKGLIFQKLHYLNEASFIIPNAWDAGSSKIITACGFSAIASSSAAFAFSKGVPDNSIVLGKTLENLNEIAEATILPISADFGYGFANKPDDVYKNFHLLAETGVVGASIEDVRDNSTYSLELSKERVKAACQAAKEFNFPFTVTARSDNFFIGKKDLKDTINRLQSFQDVGADVLFAPGLCSIDEIKTVLSSIDKPLNVVMGIPNFEVSIAGLKKLGVKRISMGAALAKFSYTSIINSLEAIKSNNENVFKDSLTTNQLLKKMKISS